MNPQEAKKLEKHVEAILAKYLRAKDTVIAAISGGADSVFLLHMLAQTKAKIIVAHVNHLLRPEAASDQQFVEKLAKSHGLKIEILNVDVANLAQKNKHGLEETGRKVRYEFFNKLAKKYHATFIITAHHADDNLETRLLNFTRGASLKGLIGMETLSQIGKNKKQKLLRPLLDINKKEILAYLKFKKIPYQKDISNEDIKYSRNFLRHEIIPRLEKLNQSLQKNSAKNTQNLREIGDLLESETNKWLAENKTVHGFNAKNFKNLHPALQKSVILKIYETKIGHTKNLESAHLEEILKTLKSPEGNKKKSLLGLTFIVKDGGINIFRVAN